MRSKSRRLPTDNVCLVRARRKKATNVHAVNQPQPASVQHRLDSVSLSSTTVSICIQVRSQTAGAQKRAIDSVLTQNVSDWIEAETQSDLAVEIGPLSMT